MYMHIWGRSRETRESREEYSTEERKKTGKMWKEEAEEGSGWKYEQYIYICIYENVTKLILFIN